MIIQLNTDNRVDGSDADVRHAETDLQRVLARFESHITRIEVHFQDANADKAGSGDKRCLIEARLRGQDPVAVSNTASTLSAAFSGARDKMVTVLDKKLARLRPPKGVDPFENPGLSL